MTACVAVLAHNEERRIATCLRSLRDQVEDAEVHVLVNGSRDRTAEVARSCATDFAALTVHDWPEGGKARSWNRFVFDTVGTGYDCYVFVDGDAEVRAGSLPAMRRLHAGRPGTNAVAGLPLNGRNRAVYQQAMREERGFFGDLYLLDARLVRRMRDSGLRLPDDVIGDDGLLGVLARTDLQAEDAWDRERVAVCEDAGFYAETVSPARPDLLSMQHKRMTTYSVRHFQNSIIAEIMRRDGPAGLPRRMASLYPDYLPRFRPRRRFPEWYFDRLALRRMRRARSGPEATRSAE